jgi:hypothetical protein
MARTIGKKNKNLVVKLYKEATGNGLEGICEIIDYVTDKLPEEVFKTWEGASTEIASLCQDLVFEQV